MSTGGYHGCYLHIELDGERVAQTVMPLSDETLRQSLGGSGLGTQILLDLDAPSRSTEDGAIAFVFSPLVGSPITTSAKFAVVCKSPLTGRLNDALASSGFAISGKATGNDAIVISGSADSWSIIVVDDDGVRLEDATDIVGSTTKDTETQLRERFGSKYEFAVIGPAGEKQVRYASISHDGRHAGRGGAGAVLGTKKIKAIAVCGTKRCRWHDGPALIKLSKQLSEQSFGPATAKYRELGTATNLLTFNRLNALPTRNFQQSTFEGAEAISPETLQLTREKTRNSCKACTIGCEHLYALADSSGSNDNVRLEYENLFALGPLCGVSDPQTVLLASKRCDELGIDTISTGGTIAFSMECVQRGLLDEPWLQFGDGVALLKSIEMIGSRQGLGDDLANGSRWFSEKIGGEATKFAAHVKGMELPGYEPRTLQTMALGFAVGARGADHNRSSAYEVDFSDRVDRRNVPDDAVAMAIEAENRATLLDSMILCKFLRGVFDDIWTESASMLQWVTGWDVTAEELRKTAEHILSQKKRFNIECGWTPDEDTLPDRFLDDALPDDSARLSRTRLAELIRMYNLQRGWTAEGFLD